MVWNQYSPGVDVEVELYKYRFPNLFLDVIWKEY